MFLTCLCYLVNLHGRGIIHKLRLYLRSILQRQSVIFDLYLLRRFSLVYVSVILCIIICYQPFVTLTCDQFAFKPTGSTTAAIIFIMHHITRLLETNDYVRCLMVDFSKVFDTVSHPILIKKLKLFNLPLLILNWIIRFLSDRTQTVIINGKVSSRLKINQSIVQGSGIGPILFLIHVLDLKPLSIVNLICKYADDTSFLIPQHTNTGF